MLGLFVDELLPTIIIQLILFIIDKSTNHRIAVPKELSHCLCIVVHAYTRTYILLRTIIMIPILVEVIHYLIRNIHTIRISKFKQLSWDGCYSGKYGDLIKSKKIIDGCTVCALTFDEFKPTTQTVALKCKHAFIDEELIHKWLRLHRSCPTCRGKV